MKSLRYFFACIAVFLTAIAQPAYAADSLNIWSQNLRVPARIYSMANSGNLIYCAGLDSGVYKSTNLGASWATANNGLTYTAVQSIAISPSDNNILYCGTDQLGTTNSGVYKTTNAGANWTLASTGITDSRGIQAIAIHPTNPNIAWIAVFDGLVNSTVGLYKTTDGGANWAPSNTGIGTIKNILSIAVNPLNPNTLYCGTSFSVVAPSLASRIYKSYNGGASWIDVSSGLPTDTTIGHPVRALSISTVDTNVVLAALFLASDTLGGAYVTTNGGTNWVRKHTGLQSINGALLRACLIRPGTTKEFFVGLDGGNANGRGVWRTTDGGVSWSDFNNGSMLNTYTIRALAFKTQGDPTIYAGAANATVAVPGRGVYEYSFPFTLHDIGVTTLARTSASDGPSSEGNAEVGIADGVANPVSGLGADGHPMTLMADAVDESRTTQVVPGYDVLFQADADTARFRAIVRNYGTFPETTYQVRLAVDGTTITTLSNTRILGVAAQDTFAFAWTTGTPGTHTARAWTLLASDANRSNDTASTSFTITPPGSGCDTLRYLGGIPAYPTISFGHTSAALGDTVYVVGGDAAGNASTTVAKYSISTGTWSSGPPLPEAKTGGDLVKAGNSLYYIGGGTLVTTPTPTCYKYTPASGWSAIANIPTAVTGNVAESWGDSVIFCTMGGWSTYLTTVQVYRIASNSWTTSTALPAGSGRRSFAGGLWGNKLFVAGGFSGAFRKDFLIGTIVRTDSIVWAAGPDVPMRPGALGSSRPGGHAVDGRFYFVAGETSPAPAIQDSIYLWDIATAQWLPRVIRGRGVQSASNYWGAISSSIVGGNVKVWIPGGSLTGVAVTGLWVIDACATTPPPTPGWTARTSGTTSFLQSVKQVNAQVIWAGGNAATVRKSVDGGATWTNANPNPGVITGDIYNIDALDANTAFVTTSPAATFIYRTTNGGTNWTQVFTQAGGFINAIRMLNPALGIASGDPVGGTFTIVGTTDGGATWTRVPPANEPVPVSSETGLNNSLSTVGTTHIWFGSSLGPVWRSTNAGTSWTRVATTFTGNNLEVHFNNTTNGVTGNSAGVANRSTDGGTTWTLITPAIGTTGGVNGLSGSGQEFFASRGTSVYRSTDRGATWVSSYAGAIGTLAHLDFAFTAGAYYGTTVSQTGGIATAYLTPLTGVKDPNAEIPATFDLAQNYPNPFNPTTTIRYALPEAANVNLSIYNVLGQRVAELANEVQGAGVYNATWDGRNQAGTQVASGIYFYRIEAKPVNGGATFTRLKKAMLLK